MIQTNLVQQFITQEHAKLHPTGVGKGFMTLVEENMKEITLPSEAMNKLVYNDLSALANHERYVLVKDNQSVLYTGTVGEKGYMEAIVHDIQSISEWMNMTMCVANEDEPGILTLLSNQIFYEQYLAQRTQNHEKSRTNGFE